jgi:hypothetical protein
MNVCWELMQKNTSEGFDRRTKRKTDEEENKGSEKM